MKYLPISAGRLEADPKIRVNLVGTAHIEDAWPAVKALLAPSVALTQGRCSLDHVRAFLGDGSMHLFVIWDMEHQDVLGALVTEFRKHPGGLALNICHLGGRDLARWIDRLLDIERWARSEGCRWVETSGRAGWVKVLGVLGYEPIAAALGKELL